MEQTSEELDQSRKVRNQFWRPRWTFPSGLSGRCRQLDATVTAKHLDRSPLRACPGGIHDLFAASAGTSPGRSAKRRRLSFCSCNLCLRRVKLDGSVTLQETRTFPVQANRGEPDGKPEFLIGHRHRLPEVLRFRPGWADTSSAGGASHRLTNSRLNEARRVGTIIKTRRDVDMSAFQAWFYSVSLSGASRPRQRICQPSRPEEFCDVMI